MQGFDYLDKDMGLEYCAFDDEIYVEVLQGYVEDDRRADVEKAYNESDWGLYRTLVHGIKSTSLTIGAPDLSAKAKALEMAAASSDEGFIKANHQDMMNDYADLLGKLAADLA